MERMVLKLVPIFEEYVRYLIYSWSLIINPLRGFESLDQLYIYKNKTSTRLFMIKLFVWEEKEIVVVTVHPYYF